MSTSINMYNYHVENLRGLDKAIKDIQYVTKQSIRSGNTQKNLDSFKRIYTFLIAAWAETRLDKLLCETHTFSDSAINIIKSQDTQLNKWLKAVELSFKQYHNITSKKLTKNNIGQIHFDRFKALEGVLKNELKAIIEVRNKLAHGQWLYPLNRKSNAVSTNIYQALNNENHLSLMFKFKIIKNLSDIVHNLVISLPTFERDFSQIFGKIENAQRNLLNRKYENYVQKLVENSANGKHNLET